MLLSSYCVGLNEFASGGELDDEFLEKARGSIVAHGLVVAPIKLVHCTADRAPINVRHGLEERRVKFRGPLRFRDGELGNGRIKRQL